MGATIQRESNGVWTLRITGVLRKAELDAAQAAAVRDAETAEHVRALVIAEDFRGWERGADWGDLDFFVEYGNRIEKIAMVAEPKWESQLLVFTGAGFRKTEVKFFPTAQLDQARAWLG